MANPIAQWPADNVAALVTPVVSSGTGDTDYPAANLVDGHLGKPAKLTTTTGSWVWDYGNGVTQRVDLVALFNANLTAGLSVQLQGNATDSWGSPTLTAAITIPAANADGIQANPWRDVTTAANYSTTGFRYWRLAVIGTNAAAVSIGDVMLIGTARPLSKCFRSGYAIAEDHSVIEHQTEHGFPLVYDLGHRRRQWRGTWRVADAPLSELREWYRSMQRSVSASLWIPDPAANDAWAVRAVGLHEAEHRQTRVVGAPLWDVTVDLLEDPVGA